MRRYRGWLIVLAAVLIINGLQYFGVINLGFWLI